LNSAGLKRSEISLTTLCCEVAFVPSVRNTSDVTVCLRNVFHKWAYKSVTIWP
jgi:hypothetical protein